MITFHPLFRALRRAVVCTGALALLGAAGLAQAQIAVDLVTGDRVIVSH